MQIKLIALDMDGTTLSPDNEITPENRTAILAAQKQDIQVIISTGRSNTELIPILMQFPDIRYFICGNGSKIYDRLLDRNIYEDLLRLDYAKKILQFCSDLSVMPEIYTDGKIYTLRCFYDNFSKLVGSQFEYVAELIRQSRTPVDSLQDLLDKSMQPVEKLNVFFREPQEGTLLLHHLESYDVSVTGSLTNNVEIGSPTASKGHALATLATQLGLSANNVMAIGDADNDISMLKYAACSVAMGNAIPSVVATARYQTSSNRDSGVAAAIHKYALRS